MCVRSFSLSLSLALSPPVYPPSISLALHCKQCVIESHSPDCSTHNARHRRVTPTTRAQTTNTRMQTNKCAHVHRQDTLADIIDSCNVTAAGELDADQTSRIFSASIKIKTSVLSKITIQLDCIAPVGAFALVEKEGSTYIHTTVMADCTAMVTKEFQKPQQFVSKGRNLMEAKE